MFLVKKHQKASEIFLVAFQVYISFTKNDLKYQDKMKSKIGHIKSRLTDTIVLNAVVMLTSVYPLIGLSPS